MAFDKSGDQRHSRAREVQDRMIRLNEDIQELLRANGLEGLELTAATFSPTSALEAAGGGWEWRCETTPSGVVCHWVPTLA
jgi:hypothetical protein